MENPRLEQMGSGNTNHNRNWICESEEKGGQRISVAHQIINGLDYQKGDSFIVDIEPHLHLSDNNNNKDLNPNSRVTLQRSLSRKGSYQKKSNNNDTTNNLMATSPREASTPEKSMVVTVGSTDHAVAAQLHNAITIVASNNGGGATPSESKLAGRRFSFKRSSSPASWSTVTDPRRILLFFATLSSMGTILLIYFTLSMSKLNGEDRELN